MKFVTKALGGTALLSAGAVFITAIDLYRALFLVPLWRWFVVPATGWPELSYLSAAGLLVALSYMMPYTHTRSFYEQERDEQADKAYVASGRDPDKRTWAKLRYGTKSVGMAFGIPPLVWLNGYLIHWMQG